MDLHMPTLDPAALEHLASLATLKSLDIRNAGPGDLSPGPLGFCALTGLSFYTAPFQFIADLIHGLSNSPVASLYLGCRDLPTENTMTLRLVLSTGIAHSKNCYYVHCPDMACGFDGHAISPLFCFGCMQNLEMSAPGRFQLDDATVWDLAQAFPELRHLSLRICTAVHYAPHLTHDGLWAFAVHCPQLTAMHIAFNATVIPPSIDSESATPDAFPTKLTELDVLNSQISSPSHVARFLLDIFPILVTLVRNREPTQEGFTAEDCENWDRVRDLLPIRILADARREE
ncbi:hypothetical protein C8J57DRAFT_1646590 [Mycena rebaudengoi]|nr:hypothetical protein C8J57DRAFT_1646590 [Mycena rebaudengoi]